METRNNIFRPVDLVSCITRVATHAQKGFNIELENKGGIETKH